MNTQTKRKKLNSIWMGLGVASYWVSLLFENAGKVSFGLAIIGIIVLVISIIYEIILHRRRLKERNS